MKSVTQEVYDLHIQKKEEARAEMKNDCERAKRDEVVVLFVDVQATKNCPCSEVGLAYYKCKLIVRNYTIYECKTHKCMNNWIPEYACKLCASLFTSCLVHYIEANYIGTAMEIIIWCDNCSLQNKNATLCNALLHLARLHNLTITLKYLLSGHTQMKCDTTHALIEKKTRTRDIFVPEHYVEVTKAARQNPCPYDAQLLSHNFFLDYAAPEAQYYSSIRPGTKSGDPTVNEVVALTHLPQGHIMFKLTHDSGFEQLPRKPKAVKLNHKYGALSKNPIPIDRIKYNHLIDLLDYIPQEHREFYRNLPHQ
ncbi:hypothetical protein B566_EDAN011237 [Ephemera danica]|nr:hypothetical protein B566_EDAN011237 [Ephemera danica]